MKTPLHYQLKHSIGVNDAAALSTLLVAMHNAAATAEAPLRQVLENFGDLLARVDASYHQYERDLELRSRSLELSSQELSDANDHLREEIIERTQAEARLQLAASVFTNAREGIMITDATGTIVEVNDAFTRISGYSREEALGQNPRLLKSGRHPPEFYVEMWHALTATGYWTGEVWNRRKDGEVYADMRTMSAVRDGAGGTQHYVALFSDITPMKEHQQQLEHLAHYDALTNLPNRVLLADRLQQAIIQTQRHPQSLAVVYLDLDGFKVVNDQHGHNVGDELLIILAQRMKVLLRESDTLARIGGDEFVAVLVGFEKPQDCTQVLDRLLQAIATPVTVGAAELHISASIGVTLYPQDGAEADQLIRHADQAMYVAKQTGKNRYHLFDIYHDAAIKTKHESLEHLRRALAQREFVLHYQPKVNMKTGEVIGVEALIRWQHPERGLLLPATFLPIMMDHQISVELDEWVIDTALTQISAWHAAGLDMPVSVNVGTHQLQMNDFVARLTATLAAHPDVQPGRLELEILETSALADLAQASQVMRACRAMGVRFALDDFGTGYSSLTYLKRLPVELLKIDQSFVRDMFDNPDDLAIVEGVVGLAAAFRRQVIAEGVETIAHGVLLLSLGCELAQGYGISHPMLAEELPSWMATWRPDPTWTAWRERISNSDDRAVVYFEVAHRHWLRSIEIFLTSGQDAAPLSDAYNGRFEQWQETEGRRRYGADPEFPVISSMHDRVHALGRDLVKLRMHGQRAEAQAQMGELRVLCDELIARFRRLMGNGEQKIRGQARIKR